MTVKKQLAKLDREVEQLHPLLNRLFNAMPSVSKVHYTQGPNEMGADFVLERDDSDLSDKTYVGVVVKCGSINQSNQEVDRQIEECRVRRLLDGKEVYINSIIVVCNGNISKNAQEKILERHRSSNVRFIGLDSLSGLIDHHLSGSIDEMPIALQEYSEAMRQEIELSEKAGELLPGLAGCFVEPDISLLSEDKAGFLRKDQVIGGLSALSRHLERNRLCLFEASMGGGKSKVLRSLALALIQDERYSAGALVPVLIGAARFLELISDDEWLSELGPAGVDLGEKQIFLLVDGLDEVDAEEGEIAGLILEALKEIESNPNIHFLLSSRPVEKYSGSLNQVFRKFSRLEIEPLKGKKAIEFLTQVADSSTITDRVLKDLSSNNLVRAFDSTPISYILLGSLLKQQTKELPATIPDLFERYFSLVLGKWEIEKGLLQQKEAEVMYQGLERIAGRMFESASFQLAESEVIDIFHQYVNERDIPDIEIGVILEKLCSRCLILFRSVENRTISFRHRTFAEYFFARSWVRSGKRDLDYSVFFHANVTAAYFFVGLIKDCPDEVRALSRMDLPEDVLRFSRLVHFGNMLQAAYTTPSAERREALKTVMLDSAKLYWGISSGEIETPLAKLSKVHLLGFFRNVIVDCYSYGDFAKHAEFVIGELVDEPKNKVTALAVFFLILIKSEVDGNLDFVEFIDEYEEVLPVEIKLGVSHEEQLRFKGLTKAAKKMAKNLRAGLRNNPNARSFIRDLYDIPIKKIAGTP